jgi:hypothetical protein
VKFEPYARQYFGMGQYSGATALDMSNLADALPDYNMRQYQPLSFPQRSGSPGPANQFTMYHYQQGAQFAGQTASDYIHPFAPEYPSQYVQAPLSRQQRATFPQYMGTPTGPAGTQSFQYQPFMIRQNMHVTMLHDPSMTPQYYQQQLPHLPQSPLNHQYPRAFGGIVGTAYPVPQSRLDGSLSRQQAPNFLQQPNPQGISLSGDLGFNQPK